MEIKHRGIDISVWQGAPDFEKVKESGVEFVIARAGYGKNNIDKQFHRTAAECNRLGIPLGVYWFSYALSTEEAAREAQYCLEAIRPYKLEYPVFFDLEYDSVQYAAKHGVTINKFTATAMANAFCGEIEKAGYYAALYTNQDYVQRMFDPSLLSKYDTWYAWYNTKLNRVDVGMWQYSSSGRVDGISGNVDMNYSLRDYPNLMRMVGLNGFDNAAPEPEYPTGTPEWQIKGLELLSERGIITEPDYWKGRMDQPMTAGEILGILSRM